MKAIETRYNGYRFRSRLEARWAIVFDVLGIRYEYEPEGFELEAGPYLPDFRLPDLKCWVEVKGPEPTKEEEAKASQLAVLTGWPVHMVCDFPCKELSDLYDGTYREPWTFVSCGGADNNYLLCECPTCGRIEFQFDGRSDRLACKEDKGCPVKGDGRGYNHYAERIQRAYRQAKSARFEHGESPQVKRLHFWEVYGLSR